MKCLCRWNEKNKKKLNFYLFAQGNDQGPQQRRVLCRGPLPLPSAKIFWKNSAKISLPSAMARGPRQRFLEKKIKISLPRARGEALGKDFSKKRTILC
jgi:hypothetical protein